MTDTEKKDYKNKLKQWALGIIEQRIAAAKTAIDNAQQAANQEEKSSAGDKYETARAMGHLEKDMHARQLAEQVKELAALHAVDTGTIHHAVTTGSFIQCTGLAFFIAAGLGKQEVDGKTIMFLSPQAPLAGLLQHKKTGDNFLFNKTEMIIEEVY